MSNLITSHQIVSNCSRPEPVEDTNDWLIGSSARWTADPLANRRSWTRLSQTRLSWMRLYPSWPGWLAILIDCLW